MAGEKVSSEKPAAKPASSGDDGLFGALCYIIGFIVPLFILFTEKKNNKFLVFHAWQSLILGVAAFVVFFGLGIVTMVLSVVTGGLASVLSCLYFPLMLVVFVAALFCAYKAYQGERYKLPMIGDFAEKQANK